MSPKNMLLHAAALLIEDGNAGRESCMVGDKEWACPDCPDQTACTERKASEDRLRTAACVIALSEVMA